MLKVDKLGILRQGQPVIKSLSFQLQAGELLILSGKNGCGKSSLLQALVGQREFSGSLSWMDTNVSNIARFSHYIAHQLGLKANLSPSENLEYYQALQGFKPKGLNNILKQFSLSQLTNLAGQLSAGQMQRLALSRLLLGKKTLWILDEPTNHLDRLGIAQLQNILSQHLAEQGMAIIVSHQVSEFISHQAQVINL